MAKGDKINVTVDKGGGTSYVYEVEADAAGRTVGFDRDDKKNLLTVEVNGRAGTTVRQLQFRLDRVIVVEEVPR